MQERTTWRKQALLAALDAADGPLSAAALHLAAEQHAAGRRFNLSTVYRTLRAWLAAGTVVSGPAGWSLADRPPPALCSRCQTPVPLPPAAVAAFLTAVQTHTGMELPPAALTITGRCRACR